MGEIRISQFTWDLIGDDRQNDYEVVGHSPDGEPRPYVVVKLRPKAQPSLNQPEPAHPTPGGYLGPNARVN